MPLMLSGMTRPTSLKPAKRGRHPLYDIGIILCVKLIALITLWWYFFSTPVSHDMTVDTHLMEQHLLTTPVQVATPPPPVHPQSILNSQNHTHERTR